MPECDLLEVYLIGKDNDRIKDFGDPPGLICIRKYKSPDLWRLDFVLSLLLTFPRNMSILDTDLPPLRRVVTAHDAQGRGNIQSDIIVAREVLSFFTTAYVRCSQQDSLWLSFQEQLAQLCGLRMIICLQTTATTRAESSLIYLLLLHKLMRAVWPWSRKDGALTQLDPTNNLGIVPLLGTRLGVTELGPGVSAPMVCCVSNQVLTAKPKGCILASNIVY